MNEAFRESVIQGNGGAGICQLAVWGVLEEGLGKVTFPLPPDVPQLRACVSRMIETRVWGLWARLWKDPHMTERGANGRKFICWTLDPKKVVHLRILRMGNARETMVYPGEGPAIPVRRAVAHGKPNTIPEEKLPKWAKMTPEEFFPFMDEYGQFRWCDWPGKITCDEDFRKSLVAEDADIAAHPAPADRDKWGGWAEGPQYPADGTWRTVKRDGKWWIVDPDGHLWWSHGPVRVSHSCGMTSYKGREDHFAFLPGPDSPFAAFYQTRDVLLWPYYVKYRCTNTYDFTSSNLYRKYGPDWENLWGVRVHRRLGSWGANTIANSSDRRVMRRGGTPYCDRFELKSRPIAETERMLSWWPFRDPFDPSFRKEVRCQLALRADELKDPWCFGFFVDNELLWGGPTDLARWTWLSPDDQPAKIEFKRRLAAKYGKEPAAMPGDEDLREFTLAIAHAYFSTVRDEFKKVAPGKLYLGCRFSGGDPFVVHVAEPYVDVMSFNYYRKDLSDFGSALPSGIDKPVMIGEFHFGALDRGPFTTGIISVGSQTERAETYRRYLESALRHPNLVGVHWHQYSDDVSTGRFDGENMQIGWTDVCDNPYPETIAAVRDIGARMYRFREASRLSGEPSIGFRFETNHPDCLYRLGEEAVVSVTATNGAGEAAAIVERRDAEREALAVEITASVSVATADAEARCERARPFAPAAARVWTGTWREVAAAPDGKGLVTNAVAGEIWTEAIQATLAAAGAVFVPSREKPYYLDGPIVLSSGQTLVADPAAEFRLVPHANTCLVRNRTVTGMDQKTLEIPRVPYDRGIVVAGGIWTSLKVAHGEVNGNWTGNTSRTGTVYGCHGAFVFNHVDGLTVKDVTVRQCNMHGLQLSDVHRFRVDGVRFDRQGRDGVHVHGASERGVIRRVKGLVYDDFIALNAWDWSHSSPTVGPIRRVLVEDCAGAAGCSVRILPGNRKRTDGKGTVACPVEDCVLRRLTDVGRFKLFDQPNLELPPGAERSEPLGTMRRIYFDRLDFARPAVFDIADHADVFDIARVTFRFRTTGRDFIRIRPLSETYAPGPDPARWREIYSPDADFTVRGFLLRSVDVRTDGAVTSLDPRACVRVEDARLNSDYPKTRPRGGVGKVQFDDSLLKMCYTVKKATSQGGCHVHSSK
ncbi:MAG TPA: hypothetical protein PKI32_05365 [Opitutales bacterium]|nr:hypothetical protein [Opitutales bacterium]